MSRFTVLFEDGAKIDIADSYDWYKKISETLANNFLLEIKKTIDYLEINPLQFKITYKDFRQVPLKKYPFVLVYRIDNNIVKIYRTFPTRKNPNKKPK